MQEKISTNNNQDSISKDNVYTIIESLITRICHDMISPISALIMAVETKDMENIEKATQYSLSKLQLFRSLLSKNNSGCNSMQTYIKENNINFSIEGATCEINALIFFLSSKMTKYSKATLKDEIIELEGIVLSDIEINTLKGSSDMINASNILAYIAYSKFSSKYIIDIMKTSEKQYKIEMQKIEMQKF